MGRAVAGTERLTSAELLPQPGPSPQTAPTPEDLGLHLASPTAEAENLTLTNTQSVNEAVSPFKPTQSQPSNRGSFPTKLEG